MCGIAGILRFDDQPVPLSTLRAMSRAVAHRGPDGDGHEVLGPCGFAHRRLSIIDLSAAGRQPMSTRDGKLWLTYNGEVYNYIELRKDLEKLGLAFFSETDSEVILNAYRAWGDAAFERFNGMWGLALWDVDRRRLVLSRDRMGVKPLYVHRDAKRLLFASEIKSMLAAEPALAELDEDNVARFLLRSTMCFNKTTFFKGVEALEPGTLMEIGRDGATRTRRFWSFVPPRVPLAISLPEASERVRELLIDSVRLRFRSDVPVGTCLSGGLDSSSIVAISGRRLGKAPDTFSVLYEGAEYTETEFVRTMQRDLGLAASEVFPDGSDLPEVLERATYHQDSPTIAYGIYSQWHVMKIASKRVKVLLDGQGGDELFGGYHLYFWPYMQSLGSRILHGDAKMVLEMMRAQREIKALTGQDTLRSLRAHYRQLLRTRLAGPRIRAKQRFILGARAALGEGLLREMARGLKSRIRPARAPSAPVPDRALVPRHLSDRLASEMKRWETAPVTGDPLTDVLWDTLVRTSIPQLLHYEDRDSMAFSIEARTPFLDYRLIELAYELPIEMKISGALTKVVLREAMKGILPEPVRTRMDKKGYPTPFSVWTRDRHRGWLRDLLTSKAMSERGLVNPRAIDHLLEQHFSSKSDNTVILHQLATLELFCRRFLDAPFRAEDPPPHALFEELDSVRKSTRQSSSA
jgi:asparagine synthase (glutamine-hydrolysing)